jgi:hypothetical protein
MTKEERDHLRHTVQTMVDIQIEHNHEYGTISVKPRKLLDLLDEIEELNMIVQDLRYKLNKSEKELIRIYNREDWK